jgi:hypothetical protein
VASVESATRDAVFRDLGYDGKERSFEVKEVGWSWGEKIAGWLSSAMVSSLLMTIGMLGLMIGLYTGGSPIPLTVGALCLLLFFFGHYVTHLVGLEDILLFGAGIALVAVDLLCHPAQQILEFVHVHAPALPLVAHATKISVLCLAVTPGGAILPGHRKDPTWPASSIPSASAASSCATASRWRPAPAA